MSAIGSTVRVRRDYSPVLDRVRAGGTPEECTDAMKLAVDLLWSAFGLGAAGTSPPPGTGSGSGSGDGPKRGLDADASGVLPRFSWIGFYEKVANADEMVLLERRDKPACSPIGLHGACGQSWARRQPLIVPDVRTLGPNYIACDPRDQSELVIPLFCPSTETGEGPVPCWGVLDVDSYVTGAFGQHDVDQMTALLEALGLTSAARPASVVL